MVTTFFLFHGDDGLSSDEQVTRLRKSMGDDANADLNITELDGSQATVPEVIAAVSSYPFLADKRLVIVKGLISHLTRKGAGKIGKDGLARLEEDLPGLPDTARLVLVEKRELPAKNAIIQLAEKSPNGYIRCQNAPKDTTNWILRRAQDEYGVILENRAAMALSAVTGDDLRRADNELIKLTCYVEEDRPITEDDVAALTPYVSEANIFKMVDAIADGRANLALELLHRLLADKDEDVFRVYGMVIRQFRLLLQAKEHLISGGGVEGLSKAIGVRPFVGRNLARQARNFKMIDLERIYRYLGELDLKMKTGRIKPELAMDLFISGLAR
jgi:DNA polymerase III subunit delta